MHIFKFKVYIHIRLREIFHVNEDEKKETRMRFPKRKKSIIFMNEFFFSFSETNQSHSLVDNIFLYKVTH